MVTNELTNMNQKMVTLGKRDRNEHEKYPDDVLLSWLVISLPMVARLCAKFARASSSLFAMDRASGQTEPMQ